MKPWICSKVSNSHARNNEHTHTATGLKPNEKVYADELEDLFYDTLDRQFFTVADDGSVEEVSPCFLLYCEASAEFFP
jgi:hypothetical protein